MDLYFSDHFNVKKDVLDNYGALDISLVTDLPLFIDPFLLFNSEKEEYQQLHKQIVDYLRFLKDKSLSGEEIQKGLLNEWYVFSEVKETWLGFTFFGNGGRGLGWKFARALHKNLHEIFSDFSEEQITKGSHLEKLCLIEKGVGKDSISDFTTNLIKDYLARYTEEFCRLYLPKERVKEFTLPRAKFNWHTETWEAQKYTLPEFKEHYIILTPKDLLTREETWINKDDIFHNFSDILATVSNETLRAKVNNYFNKVLPFEPTEKDYLAAAKDTARKYPTIFDYYIKNKERNGASASKISAELVSESESIFIENTKKLISILNDITPFYDLEYSYEETLKRAQYFKQVIEDNDGYRLFYIKDNPVGKEEHLQIAYKLVWYATGLDVNREPNNGRGPADYAISKGANDKTIVEFKLASNTHLANILTQVEILAKANKTQNKVYIIMYYTESEEGRVKGLMQTLNIEGAENVILIDARKDNKVSASKAKSIN